MDAIKPPTPTPTPTPAYCNSNAVLDRIPLPRLSFSWPRLELVSSTAAGQAWLPLSRDIKLFNPRDGEPKLAINFSLIFAQSDEYQSLTTYEWVDALLRESAAGAFDHSVILQPRHYRHPTVATVFLSPGLDGATLVEVILLRPIVDIDTPDTPARAGDRSEFINEPLPSVADKSMSLDETDALLLQFTKGTLDKDKGIRVLTDEEIRVVVDELPEIVFTANTSGEVTFFNKRWYEFVSRALPAPPRMPPTWDLKVDQSGFQQTGLNHVDSLSFDSWRSTFHPDDLARVFGVWVRQAEPQIG